MPTAFATWMLDQEARAMLTRLARVRPFALHETMVPAAAVSRAAQLAIEGYLAQGRRRLRSMVRSYIGWLQSPPGRRASAAIAQRRYTLLRLRFNTVLAQFDIFADVMTQRSEHSTGVWLAGLDALASDALRLHRFIERLPVVCYLDRGPGAAIRRARTRLPGGGSSPVAIVRIPRERMVGSGIASSLVHEVGHQAAALLDLVQSLVPVLRALQTTHGAERLAWRYWERCLGEVLADLYSVARIGVGSTLGLIAVVSVPRAFVFRFSFDDPHPFPWIRVKLSCALGHALYPDPQWRRIAELWQSFYPLDGLDRESRARIALLESTLPAFVALLVNHRPRSLRGASLREALDVASLQPERLAALWESWRGSPARMHDAAPCLVLAVIGQAKSNGRITPEEESRLLGDLLTHWALHRSLEPAAAEDPQPSCPVCA